MGVETVRQFVEKLPIVVAQQKLDIPDVTLQLLLSGKENGEWGLVVEKNNVNIQSGLVSNPRITISADSDVFLNLLNGTMDPFGAYMDGSVRISGDLGMVLSLAPLFKLN